MKKYLKLFILSSLLLVGGLLAFAVPFKPHASSNWSLNVSDGYYYYNGSFSSSFVDIKSLNGEELEYSHSSKSWSKVPDYNEYYPTSVKDYSKVAVKLSGSMSFIYELAQPKLVGMNFEYQIFERLVNNVPKFRFKADLEPPIINGPNNLEVTVGVLLTESDILSNFITYDNSDANPTLSIKENNYSSNYDKVGSYTVVLQSLDKYGNAANKTISITVLKQGSPRIDGPAMITVSMIEELSDNEILSHFKAFSSTNVLISSKMIVKNKSDYIYNQPGEYLATVSVTDNSVEFEKHFKINVVDDIAPVITGPKYIEVTEKTSDEEELAKFSVTDNYDEFVDLVLIDSNYTFATKPGEYSIKVLAVDSSGNRAVFTSQIKWLDINPPVINGPKVIYKSTSDALPLSEFLQYFWAEDDADGSRPVLLNEDNYTGKGDIRGTYQVKVHAFDKSNNYSVESFQVVVTNKINGFYIVDNDVKVARSYNFNKRDVIAWLEVVKDIKVVSGDKLDIVLDNYEKDTRTIGAKGINYITLTRSSGVQLKYTFETEVVSSEYFNIVEQDDSNSEAVVTGLILFFGVILIVILFGAFGNKRRRY